MRGLMVWQIAPMPIVAYLASTCLEVFQAGVAIRSPGKTPRALSAFDNRLAHVCTIPSTEQEGALEQIIVTAQRRSENLERTPVAISVVTPDELAKQAIVSESDLPFAVPGLMVRSSLSSNELNYALRGQSTDAFNNAKPAVLPYNDEIQLNTQSHRPFTTFSRSKF
jgi:outer membrane receptor protein involved in Fe transport